MSVMNVVAVVVAAAVTVVAVPRRIIWSDSDSIVRESPSRPSLDRVVLLPVLVSR